MASLSKKYFANSLWLVILGCFLISEVDLYRGYGEVRLKVLLTRFSNPSNRNALRQCCDGKKNASICTDSCDIFFAVCTPSCKKSKIFLRNGSEFIASQRNLTSSGENTDGNFLSMSFQVDPMRFTRFSIRLYDDDSQDISLSGNQSLNEVVINYTESLPRPLKNLSYHRNISRNNISFEFVYSLHFWCKENFYGDECAKWCQPRNDRHGHKKCFPNGTSVCLRGWKGDSCTEPICPGGCKNNGICKKPYSCSCDTHLWTGPTCERCVPDHQCLHATCTPLKRCICKKNWTGIHCNVYKDYCSRYHPCKNGRCQNNPSRNYTCSCNSGWSGDKCDKFLCSSSCNLTNAICTTNGKCSCNAGWDGADCNRCIPTSNCTHGYCNGPFECLCKEGWRGENCTEPVNKSRCSQQNPCQNDGKCVDDAAGNYHCVCKQGFTGHHCKDNVLCSSSCNLTNAICTTNGKCSCNAGWTDADCNRCIPTSNCTHGYCNVPFECFCEEGWRGENCTEPVIKSRCSQQNPCQNDGKCVDDAAGNYHCVCKQGFSGHHCKDKVSDLCSTQCNKSNGYCHDNECRCLPGWRGPSCTKCVRNSSCVHGFCRLPFECICLVNWTGPSCNISRNSTNECTSVGERPPCGQVEQIGSNEAISDNDRLIYILSSVLVLVVLLCLAFLAWRLRRRRATFDVPSSPSRVNAWENEKPSYVVANGNSEGQQLSLDNNNSVSKKSTSPEILLNPMALQPSQNSRSMLLKNEPETYECNDVINNEDNSPDSSEYRIL